MITLLAPYWLLCLPLPWLIKRFGRKVAQLPTQPALRLPFFAAMGSVWSTNPLQPLKQRQTALFAAFIWLLLILAASQPTWLGPTTTLPIASRHIFLAIDVSGSMRLPDMQHAGTVTDRLTPVKAIAKQFVSHRKHDQVGLILFGSKAFLQAPLTFDTKTVATLIDDATVGLAGQQTAIGDAIALAINHSPKQTKKNNRVVILLTDGANNAGSVPPLEAARIAADRHLRIYTIGFGSDQTAVNTLFGKQKVNNADQLDSHTLKQIAQITGGHYFRAKDPKALNHIYQQINQLEPSRYYQPAHRQQLPLYPWPLGLALLLSFWLVRPLKIQTEAAT